jgi:ketosteroid isomerase-like protein
MTDLEQIEDAEERLMSAVKNRDVATLEEMLHEQIQFIDSHGKVTSQSQLLNIYRSGNLFVKSIDVCDQQVSLTGDTAVVIVIEKVKGTCGGRPFEGRYLYMRVWKRKDSSWKVFAASCSAVPVVEF